jgi:glycosyltransferase involved in cell wall biosynthesis
MFFCVGLWLNENSYTIKINEYRCCWDKMNPLTIGLISYRSNPHCGGQGVYIRNLSHALAALGHRVEVIAGPPAPILHPDVTLTMLSTLDLYRPDDLFRTPGLDELKDPVNLLEWLDVSAMGYPEPLTFGMRLVRYLKETKKTFDIIHDNQSLSYGILSLSRRMPVTATIHHPITVDRRMEIKASRSFLKKLKVLRWFSFVNMQKKVARKLPQIITVSESSKKDIAREYKVHESRFRTIPIGIDTELFYPMDSIRREPGRIITTNSADMPLKGLYYLLHAVKAVLNIRPLKLTIVGTPKKDGEVEKLIKQLELAPYVNFTGRIDHERFVREYAKAELAVVPSLYEGFGLPVGEAMACRVPVISTTGGALPEVAGDAAKLVPPRNISALKEAILELLEDSKQREALAEKGYKRVLSEFTWEKTAIETAEAYREVIHAYC